MGKLAGFPLQKIQAAAVGADPEPPLPVFVDRVDAIVAQTVRIGQVVLVAGEHLGGGVPPVEALIGGAHPDRAPAVGKDAVDGIAAEAARVGRVVPVDGDAPGLEIEPVDATA